MNVLVHKWINNKDKITYNFDPENDKYIPIFPDDTIEKAIIKISLVLKSIDDTIDITKIPYIWTDKKALRISSDTVFPLFPWKYKNKKEWQSASIKFNDENLFFKHINLAMEP